MLGTDARPVLRRSRSSATFISFQWSINTERLRNGENSSVSLLSPSFETLPTVHPITGDVVFAKFFRTPVIVLNSREAAVDLMEKRSAKYSDRPPLIVLRELWVISLFVLLPP